MKPSPELAALFTPVLEWLDKDGDEQMGFAMWDHYREFSFDSPVVDYKQAPCGTSACIVGALAIFNQSLNPDRDREIRQWAITAEDLLISDFGMDKDDADVLFYGNMIASPTEAAATVRHWIATGEVKWVVGETA